MNTPLAPVPKSALHPLIVAAAVAVMLVSGLGAAAIMGWLPSSAGKNSEAQLSANGQPITSQYLPTAVPQASIPAHHRTAPAHHSRSPENIASASSTTCSECGVIDAINEIDTRGQGSGMGAAGGAIVGGLLVPV